MRSSSVSCSHRSIVYQSNLASIVALCLLGEVLKKNAVSNTHTTGGLWLCAVQQLAMWLLLPLLHIGW